MIDPPGLDMPKINIGPLQFGTPINVNLGAFPPTFRAPIVPNIVVPNITLPVSLVTQTPTHVAPPAQIYRLNLEGLEEDPDPPEPLKKPSNETPGIIKKTKSQMPSIIKDTIFDPNLFQASLSSDRFIAIEQENTQLRQLNAALVQDIELLRSFIRKNFKSPELVGKSDKQTKLALDKCFLDKPLVVLMYASPLVRIKETNGLKEFIEMDLLDYSQEFSGAIGGLQKTGNAIMVKQIHGTLERFQHVLTDNPVGLHFSGHGIKNTFQNLGQDYYLNQNQGNCLVFEQNDGIAHYVSQEKLKQIVSASSLKFVFIATCHSQFAGEIFHNAGVEHVICVQQNVQILDEAAVVFSQNFYELLFKETLTVCMAFDQAKKMLEAHPNPALKLEAPKFIIFRKTQIGEKHECKILGPFPTGHVQNLTPKPKFSFDVAKVEEFVGRQIDMEQVIICILKNRLVTLKGIPGIGKTTISKCLGKFIAERQIFQDGVIYISMRGHDQTSQLVQQMYFYFTQKIENQPDTSFTRDQRQQVYKILSYLKDRKVLLIIDNLEDAIRKDRATVRELLQELLERTPDLKILSTSRDLICDIGDITEKVHELKHLNKTYTIQLLAKKSRRDISTEEIKELLSLKLSKQLQRAVAKPHQREQITKLEDHHLCDLLAGHPMTVSLVAPLLQNSTLTQLYQKMLRMMSNKNLIQNLHVLNPIDSLKVSTDASVQYVRSVQPQAIDLFCLLGMLPGGISDTDLNQLWHNKDHKEWDFLIDILKNYSLLVERTEFQKTKFMLSVPIMNIYAVSLLKPYELRQFQDLIVEFFTTIFQKLFVDLCVEDKRSKKGEQQKIRDIQLEYETNIYACIYRVCYEDQGFEVNPKKQRRHRHHVIGYSSADEYESVLISEMTSDAELSEVDLAPPAANLHDSKVRSVLGSELAHSQEDSHPGSPNRLTTTIKSNDESSFGDKASLGPIPSRERRSSSVSKRVRFFTPSESEARQYAQLSEYTRNNDYVTGSVIQEDVYDSDSSMPHNSDSSARGSIVVQRVLSKSKTEGDLFNHVQLEQVEQAQEQLSDSPPRLESLLQADETSVKSFVGSDQNEEIPFEVARDSLPFEKGKFTPQKEAPVAQLKHLEFRSASRLNNKLSKKPLTFLEPIQESIDYLTKDGLLLVIFVSVQILNVNYRDAFRVIEMAHKYAQTDAICRANLLKLQGLIFLQDKKYKKALQSFESASVSFSAIAKRYNPGVALCFAAEGYLMFNKTTSFITDKMDENQLYQKACEKFEAALNIYKEAQHIAGQAFCTKQLGAIKKKMGQQCESYFKESRKLERQKVIQIKEGKWIHRFDGDAVSLFIEIIGEEPKRSQAKKAIEIKPETWIPRIARERKRYGSQTRKDVQETDVLSSDDEFKKSKRTNKTGGSGGDQSTTTQPKTKAKSKQQSSIRARNQIDMEKAKYKFEAQQRKKEEMKIQNQKQLFQKSQKKQIVLPTVLPHDVSKLSRLEYSWAYKIDSDDPEYIHDKHAAFPWISYDFEQNFQIEQFYQQLVKNQSQRSFKLKIQPNAMKQKPSYLISIDQKKPFACDPSTTCWLQQNMQTQFLRQVARLDQPCIRTSLETVKEGTDSDTTSNQSEADETEKQHLITAQWDKYVREPLSFIGSEVSKNTKYLVEPIQKFSEQTLQQFGELEVVQSAKIKINQMSQMVAESIQHSAENSSEDELLPQKFLSKIPTTQGLRKPQESTFLDSLVSKLPWSKKTQQTEGSSWFEETKFELPKEATRPSTAAFTNQDLSKRRLSKYANVQSTVKSYVEGRTTAEEIKPRLQQPEDLRNSISKAAAKPQNSQQINSKDWRRK